MWLLRVVMAASADTIVPHFIAGHQALTLFGWTPGLRCLVAGQRLECGCLAGVYETKRAVVVTLIDHRAPQCAITSHAANLVLDVGVSPLSGFVTEPKPSADVVPIRRGAL